MLAEASALKPFFCETLQVSSQKIRRSFRSFGSMRMTARGIPRRRREMRVARSLRAEIAERGDAAQGIFY
jgi:hypothetical protein